MTNLFRSSLLSAVVLFSSALSATTLFEQTLGESFDDSMPYKDLSDGMKVDDGTLPFAYIPKKSSSIKFDYFTSYLTPLSEKVAIIEAGRTVDSMQECESLSRFVTSDVIDDQFPEFQTIDKLKSSGFTVDTVQTNSPIKLRVNPSKNHFMQFGCVQSSSDSTKFTFILSLSDASLKGTASNERDKIIATKI